MQDTPIHDEAQPFGLDILFVSNDIALDLAEAPVDLRFLCDRQWLREEPTQDVRPGRLRLRIRRLRRLREHLQRGLHRLGKELPASSRP